VRAEGGDTGSISMVLLVDQDAASLPVLVEAAELEGLRPVLMASAADAGILALRFNHIVLLVLDISSGAAADPTAARRLRVEAAHVGHIPVAVMCDRPLTKKELDALRPIATAVKPLHLGAARAMMRAASVADVMK
jgi:DNA-binding response OmpR family regulator